MKENVMTGLDALNEYKQEIEMAKQTFNKSYAFKSILYKMKNNKDLTLTICGRPNQIHDFNNYQLKPDTLNLDLIANWLITRNMAGVCGLNKSCLSPILYLFVKIFNRKMSKNGLLLNLDYLFLYGFLNSTENIIHDYNLNYEEVKQSLNTVQNLLDKI